MRINGDDLFIITNRYIYHLKPINGIKLEI